MSASDHLSQGQFMPMDEAMGLHSRDYGVRVADAAERVRNSARYETVKASLNAVGQRDPIRVEGNDLYGGHHRIVAAHDLGWSGVRADVKYR